MKKLYKIAVVTIMLASCALSNAPTAVYKSMNKKIDDLQGQLPELLPLIFKTCPQECRFAKYPVTEMIKKIGFTSMMVAYKPNKLFYPTVDSTMEFIVYYTNVHARDSFITSKHESVLYLFSKHKPNLKEIKRSDFVLKRINDSIYYKWESDSVPVGN